MTVSVGLVLVVASVAFAVAFLVSYRASRANRPRRMMRWATQTVRAKTDFEQAMWRMRHGMARVMGALAQELVPALRDTVTALREFAGELSETRDEEE